MPLCYLPFVKVAYFVTYSISFQYSVNLEVKRQIYTTKKEMAGWYNKINDLKYVLSSSSLGSLLCLESHSNGKELCEWEDFPREKVG